MGLELIVPISLYESESESGTPSGNQVDQNPFSSHSTKGEPDPRNREEGGGRETLVQRPPEPTSKPALDSNQGVGDATQDELGRDEELPTWEAGTPRVAIGATEHGTNPTSNNREDIKPTEALKGTHLLVESVDPLFTCASSEKGP
jgi:hypothetical protein